MRAHVDRRWWMLVAVCLAVLVLSLDFTVLNVALPSISRSLNAGTADLQWIVDAYSLAIAGAMLPFGAIADRVGRKRVMLAGLGLFLLASVAAALSETAGQLIAARAVLGVGSAIILPLTPALVITTFSGRERTRAMAVFTAAVGAGMPCGPIVGGALLQRYSWSSVFWINVPILAIAFVAGLLLIDESRGDTRHPLDIVGGLFAVVATVTLVYGVIRGPESGWSDGLTVALLIAAVIAGAAFVAWERRVAHPLMDLPLFRKPQFTWNTVAIMIVAFALAGVIFVVPLYLQAVRGFDSLGTGLRIIPMMAGLLVAGALATILDRTFGGKGIVISGLVVMGAGLLLLARVDEDTAYVWLAVGLAGCGFGVGAVMATSLAAAVGSVGDGGAGSGSAVVNTLRQVGSAVAVAAMGSVLSGVYQRDLDPALGGLPAAAADTVRQSLFGAAAVAETLGPSGAGLLRTAHQAYVDGMSMVMWCCFGLAVAGAVLCLAFLPNGDSPAAVAADDAGVTTAAPSKG
ncbi:MFS transporter [Micromonospora sp. NPDC023888]|uniref:MFS transporter n=1 Tax=Micromonospora sp. NPDC023888 TaxID=3155607 RepID=UPI0033EB361E